MSNTHRYRQALPREDSEHGGGGSAMLDSYEADRELTGKDVGEKQRLQGTLADLPELQDSHPLERNSVTPTGFPPASSRRTMPSSYHASAARAAVTKRSDSS